MECKRCGEFIQDETSRFCPRCGYAFYEEDMGTAPDEPKRSRSSKFWLLIVLAVIFLIYWYQKNGSLLPINDDYSQQYINFVRNGSPTAYPDTTYGKAFDNYFANGRWDYFRTDDGKDVVEFTGDCMYRDAQVTATIQFLLDVDNGTFDFEYLAFNDVPQIALIKYALITSVFEGD